MATDTDRPVGTVDLVSGSVLVTYTDGLIERRKEDLTLGPDRVRNTLHRPFANPEAIADALVATAGKDQDDDIAITVLELLAVPRL